MTLKFTFTVHIDSETLDTTHPVVLTEKPRFKQTFFDWFQPEESIHTPQAVLHERPVTLLGTLRQLYFPWYEDLEG